MSLMLGIYDTPARNTLLLDATSRVTACSFATNEHGFASLQATIQMPLREAFTLYDRAAPLFVALYDGAKTVWRGRLEDTGLQSSEDGTALTITALGGWQALADVPYTALWSDSRTSEWRVITTTAFAPFRESAYEFDTNNRLIIKPKKNETVGITGSDKRGGLMYVIPHLSSNTAQKITFTYNMVVGAGWEAALLAYVYDPVTGGFTFISSPWVLTASGTATVTATLPANCTAVVFSLRYTLADALYPLDTGNYYLILTALRVYGTASTLLYADEIARGLVAYVNAINPTQMNPSTALIQSPTVDLVSELYEDALPSDILSDLAARGDNQVPPRKWEVGVWEDQTLFFRPRGSAGQAWSVDVSELELERTLAVLYNSTYAVYQDVNSRVLRTAAAVDAASLALAGITRRAAVSSKTTSATNAGRVRDAALEDSRNPLPRAAVRFDAVYTASGARAPLYNVRSGDTITIRNLPPSLSPSIDRIRSFRISRAEFDCMNSVLSVEPEAALPTVATQIADLAVRGSSGQPTGKQSAIDVFRGTRM